MNKNVKFKKIVTVSMVPTQRRADGLDISQVSKGLSKKTSFKEMGVLSLMYLGLTVALLSSYSLIRN